MAVLRTLLVAGSFALMLLVMAPSAEAQVNQCGDLQIIFLNPDLQPGSDGFIRASGALFAQFQVIGEGADKAVTLGFSFGAYTTDIGEEVCALPPQLWFTGQQLINYRADTDPSDGFWINLQTPLVPDGEYTAAVHAYDAADNELARFWAKAIVNNCDAAVDPAGQVERCTDDAEQLVRNDRTAPWPMILPGDGSKLEGVTGFSLEFAEELSSLLVTLNGADITDQLEAWEGRAWDDDLIPGYGPHGLGAILVPECSQQPPQQCSHLGEAYKWNVRELNDDDVIRVEAMDLAGNVATKDIHIGSSVTSGAISADIPILTWNADRTRAEVTAGQSAVYRFTIQNSGAAEGHPFAEATVPDHWQYEWQPGHRPVASGGSSVQELIITPSNNATAGEYPVTATMNYMQQGQMRTLSMSLVTIVIGDSAGPGPADNGDEAPQKRSPVPLGLGALAIVAVAVARRRRLP